MDRFETRIPLPFILPIKTGLALVSVYSYGHYKCTFLRRKAMQIAQGEDSHFFDQTLMSIALEMKDPIPKHFEHQEVLRYVMTFIIAYINKIIDAFRQNFSFANVRNISINDLPLILVMKHNDESYLYLTNPHKFFDDQVPELDREALGKIGSTLASWDLHPDQFLPDQFLELARSNIFREEFPIAIVQLQTSFEVFIDNCLRLAYLKEAMGRERISKILERTPFRQKVEKNLSRVINVKLQPINEANEQVKAWYNDLYLVRNEIIHNGKTSIDRNMAFSALEAYISARNYIADKLVELGLLSKYGTVSLGIFDRNAATPEFKSYVAEVMKGYGYDISRTDT